MSVNPAFPEEGDGREAPPVRLRLMETSDLHMFVYAWDYYRACEDNTVGLARVASLIRAARAESENSLLFDNGDIVQGNPLGDYIALPGHLKAEDGHRMFRAMNRLGYDAATLGNHEFNYGLSFLEEALRSADFPFVCANAEYVDGTPLVPREIVLEREVTDKAGQVHQLRIGVIGFLPPQIVIWDAMHLAGRVTTTDIVEAARRYVPALRARCDVLVALCHSGISSAPRQGGDENAALYLAEEPGIDVVFAGHAHRVFPGPDYDGLAGVDAQAGRLAGKPAVMPGFWGSHLGVIDLELRIGVSGWYVADSQCEVRPVYKRESGAVVPLARDDALIVETALSEHEATIAWMARQAGETELPLNTYFTFLQPDPCLALINAAQLWYVRPLLAGTDAGSLPLLSAATPFKAGGLSSDAFVDIPAGPLTMRDLANIYTFTNTICVLRCSGAEVKEWLEKSAVVFNRIVPGVTVPQRLLASDVPAYNFDVIAGVTYAIDVTQPARYTAAGMLVCPDAHRIRDLRFDGVPVDPDQSFAMVTNNYRAGGGGHFAGTGSDHVVLTGPDGNRDAVIRYVTHQGSISPSLETVWRFACPSEPVTVFVELPPAAAVLAGRNEMLQREDGGEDGFDRYTFVLS
ncbi:bifunctional 2',3'-cyclic-nucleotide 2'-phosphodiesterase/3'-nucleotidase [Acetobacter oeni]|uniref:2',3'-cyclic-nucleotide 2'-phosphodiesterase n=1 Tax=Acetobacter oeni TaxID=304077 RepID=A0A511XM10_9PROT|nr:bifunctional 2',3'-cyclic-nucleotide 2'-phosphodiesterase/3'-nucleotidase [Acetobacter oeni]MBB3883989.1 2',3'-cyclic-nucleotide 2'-phosphodiesterase/3'-nucleotidase [Acetobacter oeni]NHO20048.1 bifunctional 2',3'-cyclic-nucleotide 2'-phosphodiesterase/3'-nucleotidase [Acetobacter oeni]GBR03818.1 5'-nucleotidase [Acetobacter oeni LMG 21952]GEN63979.1 2',3'-cyclic-nucleotide 2'-phosphodiesterase [Acetobacter oeni]